VVLESRWELLKVHLESEGALIQIGKNSRMCQEQLRIIVK
jgi:hypothetical protein